MGKVRYTDEQRDAIETKGNVIVSAGAGSGKTQVLTERVIHFVDKADEKIKINQFLILTFTNLAAGEMKERIRKALIKNNCMEAASLVDTANICTFDSYALSLVKKYHFLLGVSPNISIIDSNIISVRKRTIIEDLFEEAYKECKGKTNAFTKMIDKHSFKNDKNLKTMAFELYEKALLADDTDKYLDNYISLFYNDDKINEMVEYAKINIINECNKFLPKIDKKLTTIDNYNVAGRAIINNYKKLDDYFELVNNIPAAEFKKLTKPKDLKENDPDKLDEEKKSPDYKNTKKGWDAWNSCKNNFFNKKLGKYPKTLEEFKENIRQNLDYVEVLVKIVKELDKRIKAYKDKYQVYEFNDIAKKSLKLVTENETIRNEIKDSLKMIMIDEYQDTSTLQESFISKISNGNVYMVGDVKQSIYKFRNAKCEIFMDKYDKYKRKDDGTAIELNKNFRSRKEVLSDINFIFKNIMTKKYGGADYRENHMILFGNKDYCEYGDNKNYNHSTILYHKAIKDGSPIEEANIIARDIIRKINSGYLVYDRDLEDTRPCKFSDFCILIDRGAEFPKYTKVFAEYKLPLYVENDEDISKCDIVLVLMDIIGLIDCIQKNEYSSKEFRKCFIGIARSFLYNYTDGELFKICNADKKGSVIKEDKVVKDIKTIVNKYSTYSLAKLLEKIISELDIYNKIACTGEYIKNKKYLDIFIEYFNSMSALDYSIEDFITFMEHLDTYKLKLNLSSTGSNIDSVKIMNIHKSKGLEFGIVYFAGLYKGFNFQSLNKNYTVSNKYGMVFNTDLKDDLNLPKVVNKMYEVEEEISEKIRLLYVALTRTKEKMIFLISTTKDDEIDSLNTYISSFIDKDKMSKNKIGIIALKLLIDNTISKSVYKYILQKFNVELPDICTDIDKEDFSLTIEDVANYYSLDNLMKKLSSRMIKEDVVIYLYQMKEDNDISEIEFKYCLGQLNAKIIDTNEVVDRKNIEISNEENIINHIYNEDEYYEMQLLIDERKIPFDKKIIKLLFSKIGYVLNDLGLSKLEQVYNRTIQLATFNALPLTDIMEEYPKTDIIEIGFTKKGFFASLFEDYKNNIITLEEFNTILNVYNYELDPDIYILKSTKTDEDVLKAKELILEKGKDHIMDLISIKNVDPGDLVNLTNFRNIIYNFLDAPIFNHDYIDTSLEKEVIHSKSKEATTEKESIELIDFAVNNEEREIHRASKKTDITTSRSVMNYGTKLHFIMETTDLKNPDYSLVSGNDKLMIENFLKQKEVANIKDAEIYKEYEFFDELNNTNGVIDLMLVYEDHIDIIDYKTKNIDDEKYDVQLQVYRNFVAEKFKTKKIYTYLYSLMDHKLIPTKEVDI